MTLPQTSENQNAALSRRQGSRQLARAILDGEISKEELHELPPLGVYLASLSLGIDSSSELLEAISAPQYRVLLDFHLWDHDDFNFEQFWAWLEALDDPKSLAGIQKFIRCVDRRLLALVVCEYTEILHFEEPSDQAPGPMHYTPDKGHTWIHIRIEDKDRHRLLGKLLALVFEMSAELFYQLVALNSAVTKVELEEDAYQQKARSLLDQGIPGHKLAWHVHSEYDLSKLMTALREASSFESQEKLSQTIEPMVYQGGINGLLAEIFEQDTSPSLLETLEAEITFLANAGIVFYEIDFHDYESVCLLIEKIKGAINIGLEKVSLDPGLSPFDAYHRIGLKGLYQIGLSELKILRKTAMSIPAHSVEQCVDELALQMVIGAARERFPVYPGFLLEDGTFEEVSGRIKPNLRAFRSLNDIEVISEFLSEQFGT